MTTRRTDLLWLFGGSLAIILLIAGGWFLVISPKFAEADAVQADADTSGIQLIRLNKDVAALVEEEKQKPTYVAQLKAKRAALPTTKSMTTFVRQLQDSGSALDVDVDGFAVGSPVAVKAVPQAAEISMTLTATATAGNLSRFFTRLQTVQPRAVLIKSISATQNNDGDEADQVLASITLSVFCVEDPANATDPDSCQLPD